MNELVGTWRLVRAQAWDGDGKPVTPPYDGQGLGRIVFTADGHMAVMMIDARKEVPAAQKREYSGYFGTYTYDGKQLVTTVECAPDPSRIGSEQPRGVRFENGLLILRPPPRNVGGTVEQRELTWERVSDV
ncbi:MAG: lipocalin-like domain-containing protein [Acetobacteraceae bacterium]